MHAACIIVSYQKVSIGCKGDTPSRGSQKSLGHHDSRESGTREQFDRYHVLDNKHIPSVIHGPYSHAIESIRSRPNCQNPKGIDCTNPTSLDNKNKPSRVNGQTKRFSIRKWPRKCGGDASGGDAPYAVVVRV